MNKETFITENAYGEDKSSLNYWKNHRNKLDDLYPSERYYAKPTDLANIPYDKVFMCCIKVEKNSKSPGIFIDIVD